MEIFQLRYFVAACDTLNFTHAASRCFTTRQNLTHAVRKLEEELGVQLFDQSAKGLTLTPEGRFTEERARRIVSEADELGRAFLSADDKGTIVVLVGASIINTAPININAALDSASDTPLTIRECGSRTCYEMVRDHKADLAFIASMDAHLTECETYLLSSDDLYFLVSSTSKLAEKDRIGISDIIGHRLLMLPEYEFQFSGLMEDCETAGLYPQGIDIVSNPGFVAQIVRTKDAVGIASSTFLGHAPYSTVAKPYLGEKKMNIYLICNRESLKRPSVRKFVDDSVSLFKADHTAG